MSEKETGKPINPLAGVHEILEKMDKVGWGDEFRFECHSGLSCWTYCCHNANIFLTPYDVIRLKKRLGMRSDEFVRGYASVTVGGDFGLPVVALRMSGEEGACPFVTKDGCDVYSDRPTSCRLYPLGHAVSSGTESKKGERVFFKIEEEHCLGWNEPKAWKLEEWVLDQGASEYNRFNDMAAQLAFHPKLGDATKLEEKKIGMIFMALYDMDTFRDFVFNSSFLDRFDIDEETVEKIKSGDEELLRFGMMWIEFSVMGIPKLQIRK